MTIKNPNRFITEFYNFKDQNTEIPENIEHPVWLEFEKARKTIQTDFHEKWEKHGKNFFLPEDQGLMKPHTPYTSLPENVKVALQTFHDLLPEIQSLLETRPQSIVNVPSPKAQKSPTSVDTDSPDPQEKPNTN